MDGVSKKKAVSFFAIGFVVGIILTLLLVFSVNFFTKDPAKDVSGKPKTTQTDDNEKAEVTSDEEENLDETTADETTADDEITADTSNDTITESGEDLAQEPIADAVSAASWDSAAAYTGGQKVSYGGKIYEAKWWTQGEAPGKSADGAWNFVSDAKPVETVPDEPEEPDDPNAPVVPAKAGVKDFKVVGYYPSWQPDKVKNIQYDNLTHINYAFAIPKSDGTLMPLENASSAQKIIKSAHKKGVKVLLAVGGWSYKETPLEPTFKEATNSPEKVKKFTKSIIDMVKKYGFDGVDMDWEHPRYQDVTSEQYTQLMQSLSVELKKDNLLLTSAVLSGVTADGTVLYDAAAHTDAVIKAVDWFNVMAYDGGDGDRHSSYDFAVNCGNYWKNTRKMPANKVVLGVPFYGRPSWKTYEEILAANPDAYKTDISNINGMEAHYNGIPTIQKKTKWACENVGGVMIWEISQDTTAKDKSLLTAIAETIKKNKK